MRSLEALKAAQAANLSDPTLQPVKDVNGKITTTFCNIGAIRVANAMGCSELNGLMADDQYKVMSVNASKQWAKVAGSVAAAHALVGGLAFAAMTGEMLGENHGHIASISPEPMQLSPSLGKAVPMVCNIGKTDADEKESAAFPVDKGEADYFIWD